MGWGTCQAQHRQGPPTRHYLGLSGALTALAVSGRLPDGGGTSLQPATGPQP
jgi:hypothetical protein